MVKLCTVSLLLAILVSGCHSSCPSTFQLATGYGPYPRKTKLNQEDWCGYVNVSVEIEEERSLFVDPPHFVKLSFSIVPVRNQILEIDFANSTITASADTQSSSGSSISTSGSGTSTTTTVSTSGGSSSY